MRTGWIVAHLNAVAHLRANGKHNEYHLEEIFVLSTFMYEISCVNKVFLESVDFGRSSTQGFCFVFIHLSMY